MSVDYKDLGVRALKTFVQGFIAVAATGLAGVTDFSTLGNVAFAGLIGGLAALVSFVGNWINATS